jgi:uncharacterized protein (DUF1778 family)
MTAKTAKSPPRTTRIEARASEYTLAIIRRAAEIEGRSISDFVVTAAQDAAERAIERSQVITLSLEAQERFALLLLDPPEPTSALRRAAAAHRKLDRASTE